MQIAAFAYIVIVRLGLGGRHIINQNGALILFVVWAEFVQVRVCACENQRSTLVPVPPEAFILYFETGSLTGTFCLQ